MDKPLWMDDERWRELKLNVIAACLRILTEETRKASFKAIPLYDPSGIMRNVRMCLFSYVVDDPEGKDVSCIKGGSSFHPCEVCMVRLF